MLGVRCSLFLVVRCRLFVARCLMCVVCDCYCEVVMVVCGVLLLAVVVNVPLFVESSLFVVGWLLILGC